MKQLSAPVLHLTGSAMVGAAIALGCASSVMAQPVPGPAVSTVLDPATLARLGADLSYPSSAQRFFEAGHTQFEQEIQRLSDGEQPSQPLLTVKPEVLKQFDD